MEPVPKTGLSALIQNRYEINLTPSDSDFFRSDTRYLESDPKNINYLFFHKTFLICLLSTYAFTEKVCVKNS